jgi:hypothetical protein
MRVLPRVVVMLVLVLALVPMTVFADESTEHPTGSLPPDQALLVHDMQAIEGASTQADVQNATAQYGRCVARRPDRHH